MAASKMDFIFYFSKGKILNLKMEQKKSGQLFWLPVESTTMIMSTIMVKTDNAWLDNVSSSVNTKRNNREKNSQSNLQ